MKASMHWCQLSDLLNEDYFFFSYYLRSIELFLGKKLGIALSNSVHHSRRCEYPWCMRNTGDNTKEERALDAGGGASSFPFLLSYQFKEVHVVDMDEKAVNDIRMIRGEIPQFRNVYPWENNILNMEFIPDKQFDVTYCISVLEHGFGDLNQHVEEALRELLRVTKRRLLVTLDVGPKPGVNGPLGLRMLYSLAEEYDFTVPEKPIDCFRTTMDGYIFSVACLCFDFEAPV